MDFIVSAASQMTLGAKLIDAGVLVLGEGGARAASGVLFSFIGEAAGKAHAFVVIDEDQVSNAAEVFKRLEADVNQPGAPLRCIAGSVPPAVVDAMPDWAYRKALESLGIGAAWETAASANKLDWIWWERALQVSTLEPEWRAIATRMAWDKHSEAELIAAALEIYRPGSAEAKAVVPQRVPT